MDVAEISPGGWSVYSWAVVVILVFPAWTARAQQRLEKNDFNIDAVTGPVLGSSRIVGMGGAYTALSDGIAGAHWNPACFASRYLFELSWWEWDMSLSLFAPGVFGQKDFFNNGVGIGADAFVFLNAGLRFQFGRFGFGLDSRTHIYQMNTGVETINITVLEGHAGIAYAFWDGQLVVGLGGRGADLDMNLKDDEQDLVHFTGGGGEIGVLLRLADQPWRLGITGRGPVESKVKTGKGVVDVGGVKMVREFVLPNRVYLPWEVQLGFAWQFGDRPLNQRWAEPRDPEEQMERKVERRRCERALAQLSREMEAKGQEPPSGRLCPELPGEPQDQGWRKREEKIQDEEDEILDQAVDQEEERIYWALRRSYESLSRHYVLVAAEVLVIGQTQHGVGVDAFLEQMRRPAGQDVSVGFRIGAETEPIDSILKLRAGFYLEPPRTPEAKFRPHGTVGLDVRLFRWDLFGLFHPFDLLIGLTADFAPRYIDVGLGVGFWH